MTTPVLIIVVILLCISFCAITYSIFTIYRSTKVLKLRQDLNRRCFEYGIRHSNDGTFHPKTNNAYVFAYDKLIPYRKMVYSFKKIELETYLDKETIDKLNT